MGYASSPLHPQCHDGEPCMADLFVSQDERVRHDDGVYTVYGIGMGSCS